MKLYLIICSVFLLDPDPRQIIPDPGIWILNTYPEPYLRTQHQINYRMEQFDGAIG